MIIKKILIMSAFFVFSITVEAGNEIIMPLNKEVLEIRHAKAVNGRFGCGLKHDFNQTKKVLFNTGDCISTGSTLIIGGISFSTFQTIASKNGYYLIHSNFKKPYKNTNNSCSSGEIQTESKSVGVATFYSPTKKITLNLSFYSSVRDRTECTQRNELLSSGEAKFIGIIGAVDVELDFNF